MTTLERFDLRLSRTSMQYAIDYGWTTEVHDTALLFAPTSRVVGVAVPAAEADPIIRRLKAHRLSYPVLQLPERPDERVFLAVRHHGAEPGPWRWRFVDDVVLPPSRTEHGSATWALPPRRSPSPIPGLTSLLTVIRPTR